MTARRPGRSLAVVAASSPAFCAVCGDLRRARLVSLGRARSVGSLVACPHCSPAGGEMPIPIYVYPFRDDIPKGAA